MPSHHCRRVAATHETPRRRHPAAHRSTFPRSAAIPSRRCPRARRQLPSPPPRPRSASTSPLPPPGRARRTMRRRGGARGSDATRTSPPSSALGSPRRGHQRVASAEPHGRPRRRPPRARPRRRPRRRQRRRVTRVPVLAWRCRRLRRWCHRPRRRVHVRVTPSMTPSSAALAPPPAALGLRSPSYLACFASTRARGRARAMSTPPTDHPQPWSTCRAAVIKLPTPSAHRPVRSRGAP